MWVSLNLCKLYLLLIFFQQANNENIPSGYEVVPLIEALNGPPQYSNTSVINSPMSEVDKLEDGGKLFEAIDKVDDGKVLNDIGKMKKNLKNVENEVSFS